MASVDSREMECEQDILSAMMDVSSEQVIGFIPGKPKKPPDSQGSGVVNLQGYQNSTKVHFSVTDYGLNPSRFMPHPRFVLRNAEGVASSELLTSRNQPARYSVGKELTNFPTCLIIANSEEEPSIIDRRFYASHSFTSSRST